MNILPPEWHARKFAVAMDLDGVIADFSEGWKGDGVFGNLIPESLDFANWCLVKGGWLWIHTCRASAINPITGELRGPEVERGVRDWLHSNGFSLNHPCLELWTGQGKPYADLYIDDKAFPIRDGKEPEQYRTIGGTYKGQFERLKDEVFSMSARGLTGAC